MAKSKSNQRYVYKITSEMLKDSDWNFNLTRKDAQDLDCVISISDGIALRMIRNINKIITTEKEITHIRKDIKKLKKEKNLKSNREKITKLYLELHERTFIKDYVPIVFNTIEDWNRVNSSKEHMYINGEEYIRLVGTTGGVKNNTVIFTRKIIHAQLNEWLDCGRNKKKKYVPAKFEAYKSLAFSSSTPVTQPKKLLVIKDGTVEFFDKVLQLVGRKLDDKQKEEMSKKEIKKYEDVFEMNEVDNYKVVKDFCDGCGMINYELSSSWSKDLGLDYIASGYNTRCAFNKGMVFTFPFIEYADEIGEYIVEDAWGHKQDIREVDLILTTNMLKLWDAYDSVEDYLTKCKLNNFEMCVAKVLPNELELVRNMNYQFLQSYNFTDEDIIELVKPTVDNIKGAIGGDYAKTLLFLKGCGMKESDFENEEYNYIKALMIDKRMMKDPFIKQRLLRMMERKINDAKKGVIQVSGNYSIISGDLYALCQSMFKKEITGLLGRGEFYSHSWNIRNVDEVVAFRAPMTVHNNIKKLKLVQSEKINKYFRFMKTCTVFNAFDCTTDAINGADFDK